MTHKEMTVEQKNVKLRELRVENVAFFEGKGATGKEFSDRLARKWAEFKGVPFVETPSELPEMVPAGPSPVPGLKSALPEGMPGPVRVSSGGEQIPAPAVVDPAAANMGKGKWTENKVPDVDPLAAVTSPAPPSPTKAVRTPP